MTRRIFTLMIQRILFVTVVLVATCSRGESQIKSERIDALLKKYHEYGQFNGAVLVAEGGKVLFRKGYGEADKEWNIPNTPETKFRLGSITKQFTSMLIMQLVEQGKIRLGGTVREYLPEYPKATGDKITIHHLLTHTSGIPNYTSFPNYQREISRTPYAPIDFIKVFWNLPLDFEPGAKFSYSNSGYFLLGVILERITGEPYARLLQERIYKPLGMTNSGYDMPGPIMPGRASGYQKQAGGLINAAYLDMTVPFSAGALYSTVDDLYKWDQGLYGEQLLSDKFKAIMVEPQVPADIESGSLEHYAYGWFVGNKPIGTSGDSAFAIFHGGSINGFNSLIVRIPETKNLIVLLNNTGSAPLGAIAQSILGILESKSYGGAKQSIADLLRKAAQSSGIDTATSLFSELRHKKEEYYLSEQEINVLGYEFLGEGKTKEAIGILKLNVEAFPQSYNVYDSLGEAFAAAGEKEQAIRNYEKSVELNPHSQSGIEALKKLKAR